jgi:hypothetical protein
MALFRRSFQPCSFVTISPRCAGRNLLVLFLLVGMPAVHAAGQVEESAGAVSSTMVYGMIGGENTQLPAYADNALGFEVGAAYQRHALMGAEFRAGGYPIEAQYRQMSFTGGYRIARQTLFGFLYQPFAYIGGGYARSQDKGLGRAAIPATWDPCWQADIGFDRTYHNFAWRMVQASWRETYTPLHSLRSLGLSTGIVYRFQR